MTDGLISIIMPAYNASGTIGEAIRSVKSQTYSRWELIVIDDGSTDDTIGIIRDTCEDIGLEIYSETSGNNLPDPPYLLLISQGNRGVAEARNAGLAVASGRYIAFLDSDDTWKEKKLTTQIALMKERNCALSFSSCIVVDSYGNDMGRIRMVQEELSYDEALYGNRMVCSTVMVDQKKLDHTIVFPGIGHEDYALWLSILKGDKSGGIQQKAIGINEPLACYRENTSSLSGNKIKAAEWTYSIYRDHLKLPFFKRIGCFIGYAVRAVAKRL